jgi:hypothetical protein
MAPAGFLGAELQEIDEVRLAETASRSVVGIMNEFAYLADAWRHDEPDLLALAGRLAARPCGPLHKRHISPDRERPALLPAQPHAQRSAVNSIPGDRTGIVDHRGMAPRFRGNV